MNWPFIGSAVVGFCVGALWGCHYAISSLTIFVTTLEFSLKKSAEFSLSWYVDSFRAKELAKTFREGDIEALRARSDPK